MIVPRNNPSEQRRIEALVRQGKIILFWKKEAIVMKVKQ